MTPRRVAVAVVAGWAAAELVLTVVLIGYGERAFAIWVFAAAVVIAGLTAAAVALASRRRPGQRREYRLPAGEGAFALPLAVTIVTLVASAVFTAWLLALAIPAATLTLALAVREHRGAPRR
jgi:hypothetical protein